MKLLAWIGGGLVALVAFLAVIGLMMPQEVALERSIEIAAPPQAVYPHVSDFEKFFVWSPWSERDPDMANEYFGVPGTVGHGNSWSGDRNVGVGRQVITEVRENELVRTHLEFEGQGEADAAWELTPVDGGTRVTWSFSTDLGVNPFGRLFGPMITSYVAADYEQGLANLQSVVESGA